MMRCRFSERWRCYWHGHRDLTRMASYGGILADGRLRELHFCLACNSPVWVVRRPTNMEKQLTWKDLQI
jgi:hypothetical protein